VSVPGAVAALVAVAFIAGAVSGALVSLVLDSDDGSSSAPPSSTASIATDAISKTAAFAKPSVVTVINEIFPSAQLPEGGLGGGAGVIVDDRGFVMTNEHIVSLPGKLTVILDDGELRSATLVSHDAPFTDLAVLRISPGGLKALPFGDSGKLVPGSTLIAIGSPDVDYQNSVTAGVASGVQRRKRLGDIWLDDLIQTDAAINVGNSGGPLLNVTGEIVGLVTFRDLGGEDPLFGIAFAMSSNSIRPIVQSMIQRGSYPRPYFGIDHFEIEAESREAISLGVEQGALVTRVFEGSPAQVAGIRQGDVVLRVGRNDITSNFTFLNALARVAPTDRVPVLLRREGRNLELNLDLRPR
jgi:S1-C subfamily serine protease